MKRKRERVEELARAIEYSVETEMPRIVKASGSLKRVLSRTGRVDWHDADRWVRELGAAIGGLRWGKYGGQVQRFYVDALNAVRAEEETKARQATLKLHTIFEVLSSSLHAGKRSAFEALYGDALSSSMAVKNWMRKLKKLGWNDVRTQGDVVAGRFQDRDGSIGIQVEFDHTTGVFRMARYMRAQIGGGTPKKKTSPHALKPSQALRLFR